jgi:sporulation protein YlmC with PRC-barrel domain
MVLKKTQYDNIGSSFGQRRFNMKNYRRVLSADTLKGDAVYNLEGENVGKIDEIMIDVEDGVVAYAVLSFGGILGMGDKLFAIPWQTLSLDEDKKRFILNVDKEKLKNAEGFDKNDWPDMSNHEWHVRNYSYYDIRPYWKAA